MFALSIPIPNKEQLNLLYPAKQRNEFHSHRVWKVWVNPRYVPSVPYFKIFPAYIATLLSKLYRRAYSPDAICHCRSESVVLTDHHRLFGSLSL